MLQNRTASLSCRSVRKKDSAGIIMRSGGGVIGDMAPFVIRTHIITFAVIT